MKIIISILYFTIVALSIHAACPTGNIFLSSQADIDNFSTNFPGCVDMPYSITIEETVPESIVNLNGLSQLTTIGGNLAIKNNFVLTNLTGLDAVTAIGGQLYVGGNAALTNLTGLDALNSIGGNLFIHYNAVLTSLTGLDALTSIGDYLRLWNNFALISLTGLDALTSIGGNLTIDFNSGLTSLTGLDALNSVGGNLSITINDALTSLDGLTAVISIDGNLTIAFNDALTSLSGLDNINYATINDISIYSSTLLAYCEVKSICDYLNFFSNSATITNNAIGCDTREQVQAACLALPVEETSANDGKDEIVIFPNPTVGIMTIKGIKHISGTTIKVTDGIGRLVKEEHLTTNFFDLSEQPNGLYFVAIKTNNQIATKRIFIK